MTNLVSATNALKKKKTTKELLSTISSINKAQELDAIICMAKVRLEQLGCDEPQSTHMSTAKDSLLDPQTGRMRTASEILLNSQKSRALTAQRSKALTAKEVEINLRTEGVYGEWVKEFKTFYKDKKNKLNDENSYREI